jgi:uncharacterized membrane protein YgcG
MVNSRFTSRLALGALLALAGLTVPPPSHAQEQREPGDPPTRVARLSYTDGSVSMQPGGEGEWGNAARNRPLTVGDKLWVDKDSRAELQAGQASVHLGSMTALSFLNLDEGITQMRLAEGSVNFRVRELREGDVYEVDTPNLAFTVRQAGAFRIDVSENGDGTRVTVLRGGGEAAAGGKTYEIHAGERGEFNGTDDNVQYSVDRAGRPDGLDRWANERDLKEDNSVSARYVSRDMPGYSDLDDYGTWDEVPTYGHVWYPTVVDYGWAPYSYGYWGWVGPWGWTWIDYAPWGFAPFHYGRWAFVGGRWGWCPGPFFGPPVYGPAFVGFFGGSHFFASVGFGFGGGIGWFPLGWGEPFFPWFRCGPRFVNVINVRNTVFRNTTIINNRNFNNFAFAHNARAVTVASRSAFVNGERINRGQFRTTDAALRGAQVTHNPGFSPTRQSHFGAANAGGRAAAPPSAIQNRQVMARTAPAQAASHMPVRTMNTRAFTPGRPGNVSANGTFNGRASTGGFDRPGPARNAPMQNGREQQLSSNRPPSARTEIGRGNSGFDKVGNARINNGSDRPGPARNAPMQNGRDQQLSSNRPPFARSNVGRPNTGTDRVGNARISSGDRPSTRTWEAQGQNTDRGRAPQDFGRNAPAQNGRPSGQMNRNDRPAWAGSGDRSPNSGGNRSYEPPQRSAPSNGNRGGYAPQRSYSPPERSYSPPSRSYSDGYRGNSGPSRTYSAPSRSYPAPSRSYSPPSRGYSGGGGSSRGGGGGSSHGGGGSSGRSGGGSASHGRN